MNGQFKHSARATAGFGGWSPANGARKNCGGPAVFVRLLTVVAMLAAMATVSAAKSLYVIAEVVSYDRPTPIQAYDIAPDGMLTFQAEYASPFRGAGTIGLALDSDSGQLFVTFEESGTLLMLDATLLTGNDTALAPGAENLAGIVYDHGRQLLYCVDRGTDQLHSYRWDSLKRKLLSSPGSPFKIEGAAAYGIALDETNGLLYVGGPAREVRVYHTWDWRPARTIPVKRAAISVAIDPENDYLYYGGGYVNNWFLCQYDLITNTEKEVQVAPDAGVMGVGVDLATGFVYVTTGQDQRPGGDDLLVYNTNLELVQAIEDIGSATGLVIPVKQTSYNPLGLKKGVQTPLESEPNDEGLPRIAIGDEFTYQISFNHDGYNLSEVVVVDTLPPEVTFVNATGHDAYGRYDPNTHTYTWLNPPLTAGSAVVLELTGRLQPGTVAGRIIVNQVTLDTDKTPPTTTGVGAIATAVVYQPLHVTKTVVTSDLTGNVTEPVYVNPGDLVTYRICVDNQENSHTVGNVVIVDTLPREVEFISASGAGLYGSYDPDTHTYAWSYLYLAQGESKCIDVVVRLNKDVAPGSTITNRVTAKGDLTPETTDTTDVVVGYTPLLLRKTLIHGDTGKQDDQSRPIVVRGAQLTYQLCFSNPSATRTMTRITLVDTLPPQVSFVTATGDGDYGSYDPNGHTYTWLGSPLAPGQETCVELVVRVLEQVEPNTVISNWATVKSIETAATKTGAEAVVGERGDPPVAADMFFKPPQLYRNNSKDTTSLMVVLHLPEGYGRELIADTPLVMTPGDIRATSQQVFGTSTQGKILCYFSTRAILAATEGYGGFELTVTGQLSDGNFFVGKGVLSIFKLGGGP
jgi:uncharacterized repeat protein (TIGR01451 family)/fimbrial isopeptide formation D2 family protein